MGTAGLRPGAVTVHGTRRLRFASLGQAAVPVLLLAIGTVLGWPPAVVLVLLVVGVPAYLAVDRFVAHRPIAIAFDNGLLSAGPFGTGRLDGPVAVGDWYQAWIGTSRGSVAHIRFGGRTLLVGGRGYRAPPATRRGDPIRAVRVSLSSTDFARLIQTLGACTPESTDPTVHIELFDAPGRGPGALRLIAPVLAVFVGGMVFGGLSFVVMLTAGTGAGMATTYVAVALTAVVAITTMRWTGGFGRPLRPARRLDIERGRIVVCDGTGRQLAAGRPQWRPGRHVTTGGRGVPSAEYPVVEIILPPLPKMTVGVPDSGFAWPNSVPRMWNPRYLVSEPDWRTLITVLHRLN